MGLHQQPLTLSACLIIWCIICPTSETTTTVSTIGSSPTSDDSPNQGTTVNVPTTTTGNNLVCYGCSDTQRGGDCQTNTRDMHGEAMDHLADPRPDRQTSRNYIKRCAGYSNYSYCVIETIENRGEVHSYIRDCSRASFSYDSGKLSNLPADNQTTCAYTGQGYVICIRLCRTSFCNGPVPMSATDALRSSFNFFLFVTFCMVLVR